MKGKKIDYESGGREFESLRARHLQCILIRYILNALNINCLILNNILEEFELLLVSVWQKAYESASLWSYMEPTPYSLRRINLSRDGPMSCISGFSF